jgi:hypothetical protein
MLIFAWYLILIVQLVIWGLTLAQLVTLRARLHKAIAAALGRESLPALAQARENLSPARMVVAPAPVLIKVPPRTAPMAASQAG